ncbi:MAG: LysR substrate-binding domain-containing protein [Rhizobiaceae bacterium]
MMNLNLSYVLNFIQIVEWGNISKAAAFLNIAQPALSRQVRSLEDTLGTQLLRRHSWGIEATENGKLLLEHARRIQKESIAIEESVKSNRDNPAGVAYLGIPSAYSVALVPPLLQRMKTLYPNINVRIVEAFSGTIYEWLTTGRLDLAILYYSKEHKVAEISPFIDEQMIAIGSSEMIGDKSELSLADLADKKLILPWRPHILRLILESAFVEQGITLEPLVEIDSMPCMKELANKGTGLVILPASAVSREIADGRLKSAALKPNIQLTTVLGQTPNRQPTQAVRILERVLQNLASELAPDMGWKVTAK